MQKGVKEAGALRSAKEAQMKPTVSVMLLLRCLLTWEELENVRVVYTLREIVIPCLLGDMFELGSYTSCGSANNGVEICTRILTQGGATVQGTYG